MSYEEVVYEGHGAGGVAIMMQVLTDNKNRTVAEIRHHFTKHGGNLGTSNSVAWMFDKKGIISIEADQAEEDQLMEIALEAGAEDVSSGEDGFEIVTGPEEFDAVHNAIEQAGFRCNRARSHHGAAKPR